ncbi:MAG TPA: sigma-70 family RNA polymerase sigma factor [Candidatus Saccharimonadales bacterium]|nr:sigma-70 family RNA polymerase sigma factor [Candidatus Saccharimonadales bacterium]
MERTRRDRRAEFEETAIPHVHALYGIALKMTRRREEAEDLVQETLLRAFRFFHRYEAGTNIKAWLIRIMRNLFINRYRKRQREPEPVDTGGAEEVLESLMESASPQHSSGASPEEILASGSVDEEIERALASLPDEYRIVLLLSAMEELSYKEIAAVLECPIGTVMSRLHRARRMMQAKLMEYAVEKGITGPAPGGGGRVVDFKAFRGAGGSRGEGP